MQALLFIVFAFQTKIYNYKYLNFMGTAITKQMMYQRFITRFVELIIFLNLSKLKQI